MKKRDKELKCVIKIEKDAKRGGERKIKMEKRERELEKRERAREERERGEKYPHSKEPFPPEISVFTTLALGGNF